MKHAVCVDVCWQDVNRSTLADLQCCCWWDVCGVFGKEIWVCPVQQCRLFHMKGKGGAVAGVSVRQTYFRGGTRTAGGRIVYSTGPWEQLGSLCIYQGAANV